MAMSEMIKTRGLEEKDYRVADASVAIMLLD